MAEDMATFRSYYEDTPNPYPTAGAVMQNFAVGAQQPAQIMASLPSNQYPLPTLLASATHHPMLAIGPFNMMGLPGIAAPAGTYAFTGDVSPNGALPSLVMVTNQSFRVTGNVTVLVNDDVTTAAAALPAGTLLLPPPAAGANTRQVETRRAVPIPHRFVTDLLQLQAAGTLTWMQVWARVVTVILADPQMLVDFTLFVDYVALSMTQREPAAAGGPIRDPASELPYTGVITTPAIQDRAMEVAHQFLPGLRPAVGTTQQLAQIQANQVAVQQAILQGNQQRKTLAEFDPNIYMLARKICESPDEQHLAPFWQQYPSMKPAQWLPQLDTLNLTAAQSMTPQMLPPILNPAYASEIGTGKVVSPTSLVTEGISIFRGMAGNNPYRRVQSERNRVYTASMLGTGTASTPAITLMIENREIELPEDGEHFRGIIEGTQILMGNVYGPQNRMVNAFYHQIVEQRTTLITEIGNVYSNPEERKMVYMLAMVMIWTKMSDYTQGLLNCAVPATLGVPPPNAPPVPDFTVILQKVKERNIMFATTLPDEIKNLDRSTGRPMVQDPLAMLPFPALPPTNPPIGHQGQTGGSRGTGGGGQESPRSVVEHPNQNPNLKAAWMEKGWAPRSLWEIGSGYCSEVGRTVIPSRQRSNQRICLPMALNGKCYSNCKGFHGVLNNAEVQDVATAGGLTLQP